MLLLLTGMETDLSAGAQGAARRVQRFARRHRGAVRLRHRCSASCCPHRCCPIPDQRLITTLFLGTALSISSVKIVAIVVREIGFLRRTVGQVIVAAAIIDDTIGWIIMAVIFGLAQHGGVDLASLAGASLGTRCFSASASRSAGGWCSC